MRSLLSFLLLCAPAAFAQDPKPVAYGCTPVAAELIDEAALARLRQPLAPAPARVPLLTGKPGVVWDLGEKRAARLSVYLTRYCDLGLNVSAVGAGELSSPNLQDAVESFGRMLAKDAPDWSFSVTPPNTIAVSKDGVTYSTDLSKLIQKRVDAGTTVVLNGVPARVLFDGWLLYIVPADASKALNLSVRSTVHPWAYYDLTPYGLPKLLMSFDKDAALIWPL